jgi:hypothetical protein
MSLINIRRERKEDAGRNPAQPPSMWKLWIGLAVVLYLIWYLGQRS